MKFQSIVLFCFLNLCSHAVGATAAQGVLVAIPKDINQFKLSNKQISLQAAIVLALKENRDIKTGNLQRKIDRLTLRTAEETFLPRLELTADANASGSSFGSNLTDEFTREIGLQADMSFPTGATATLSWSRQLEKNSTPNLEDRPLRFTLSQPLLQDGGWAFNTAPVRIARLQEEGNRLTQQQIATQIVEEVIFKYRQQLLAIRRVEIATLALQRAEQLLEVNNELLTAGRVAKRELSQAKSEILTRQLQLSETQAELSLARLELLSVLDLDGVTELELDERLSIGKIKELSIADALKLAYANRPSLRQSQVNYEIAKISGKNAKNASLWRLDLSAEINTAGSKVQIGPSQPDGALNSQENTHAVGLRLSIPIGDSRQKREAVEANIQVLKQQLNVAEQTESLRSSIEQLVGQNKRLRQRLGIANSLVTLAKEQLNVEQIKLSEGLSSILKISEMEDRLVQAQNTEASAAVAFYNGITDLNSAMGVLLQQWKIEITNVSSDSPVK